MTTKLFRGKTSGLIYKGSKWSEQNSRLYQFNKISKIIVQKINHSTLHLNPHNQFHFAEEYLLPDHPLQAQLDHKDFLQVHKNVLFDQDRTEDTVY